MTTDVALFVMRLGYAALLIGFHGWTRLLRAFHYAVHGQPWTFVQLVEGLGVPFPGVFAVLSAMSESIAVVFIVLGLFTRWAAAVIVINFSVAVYSEAHKGDPIELPALYLLSALVIAIAGPGRFAIGRARRKESKVKR
jgi:putative oxidoreductase